MTVKINNKNYEVPELTFAHSKRFEQAGLPVTGLIDSTYLMTAVSAFVQVVVGCSPEQADFMIEQHVLGGGDLSDIYTAYVKALTESGFFKRILGLKEEKKTAKKTKSAEAVEVVETEQTEE